MRYRKKPVVIEAYKVPNDSDETSTIPQWMLRALLDGRVVSTGTALSIKTLEGTMRAEVGDFVIRGVKGELYPCKPDIFHETYEEEPELGSA